MKNGYKYISPQVNILVTGTSTYVSLRAVAIFYLTSNGCWRMKFNIGGTSAATTTETITISGITFKNFTNFYQSVACHCGTGSSGTAYAIPNTSTIKGYSYKYETGLINATEWSFAGEVELNSAPTQYLNAILKTNATHKYISPSCSLIVTGNEGFSLVKSTAYFYLTSNNIWRMKFDIKFSKTNNTNAITLTISGISFSTFSSSTKALNIAMNNTETGYAKISGTNNIIINSLGGGNPGQPAYDGAHVGGDIDLSSIPTAYLANTLKRKNHHLYVSPMVNLTDCITSGGGAGAKSIIRAVAIFYKTIDNIWRMKFNIIASDASPGSVSASETGVNILGTVINSFCSDLAINSTDYSPLGSGTTILHQSYESLQYSGFSGDVVLLSKPTRYLADDVH